MSFLAQTIFPDGTMRLPWRVAATPRRAINQTTIWLGGWCRRRGVAGQPLRRGDAAAKPACRVLPWGAIPAMLHIKLEMLHIQHGMFRCKQEMGLFLPGMLRSKQGKPPFQGRAVAAAPPLNNGLRGNAALPVIRWPSASGGRPQGPRWGERPRELLYFSFYPKPSTINFQPSTDFSHR